LKILNSNIVLPSIMRCQKISILIYLLLISIIAKSQVKDTSWTTPSYLDSVIVQGFSQSARLRDAAAAVGLVRSSDWQRFSPASSLPAINTIPGVRMEERSPGSYRLAIRGSSLRSPFGVRNVRMYYDQLPFTDPGGNTYLNGLPATAINQLEILKGPAGSRYGAGTGGVLLAEDDTSTIRSFSVQYMTGSYGLNEGDATASFGTTGMNNRILVHHQQSDGYRDQTSMHRTFGSWKASVKQNDKAMLQAIVLYSDLFYETPGGLTAAQFAANPRQARPAAGAFPSAESAKASISQKTFFSGLHQQFKPTDKLNIGISFYGAFTNIENPSIRNYEKRSEPHFGGRAIFDYTIPIKNSKLILNAGSEWQQGRFHVNVYKNNNGEPDSLQTSDAVTPENTILFSQAELRLANGWHILGGLSWNNNKVSIRRESVIPNFEFNTAYQGEWAPRFSVLKKLGAISVYGLVSKGFSPPTTAELLPSTSIINTNLKAEWGWNYEAGLRGRLLRDRLWFDLNIFYFRLQDAIVQRRDASGADYFQNAGTTRQQGLEAAVQYTILKQHASHNSNNLFMLNSWGLKAWATYAMNPFEYDDFKQVDNDYSGNKLPGVAKQVLSAGIDIQGPRSSYAHLSYQYSDPIWLNDANTAKAAPYQLMAARLGITAWPWLNIFLGADNLFNVTYSLGNDINAAGGRYYNVAPERNYYAGIRVTIL
jgi:iron complex outermembrane receptor protein